MDLFAILSPFGEFVPAADDATPDPGTGDPDPYQFTIHASGPDPDHFTFDDE